MEVMEPVILPHRQNRHFAVHALRSLLGHDDRFAWAGVTAFGLREWGYEPAVNSIDQAILVLLRNSGPMTLPKVQTTLGNLYRVNPNLIASALISEYGKTVTMDAHGRWQSLP
jgi:hypothetical protein